VAKVVQHRRRTRSYAAVARRAGAPRPRRNSATPVTGPRADGRAAPTRLGGPRPPQRSESMANHAAAPEGAGVAAMAVQQRGGDKPWRMRASS
jgi:hypothetical protein